MYDIFLYVNLIDLHRNANELIKRQESERNEVQKTREIILSNRLKYRPTVICVLQKSYCALIVKRLCLLGPVYVDIPALV